MIPEEVGTQWAAKLSGLPDLALPFPSVVTLTLLGVRSDIDLALSLDMLMKHHPREVPLDACAAKCRTLDEQFWRDVFGASAPRRAKLNALEATCIATDEAIHYLAPRIGAQKRWPWPDVKLAAKKNGKLFSKLQVSTREEDLVFGLGTPALANLLTIYSWARLI